MSRVARLSVLSARVTEVQLQDSSGGKILDTKTLPSFQVSLFSSMALFLPEARLLTCYLWSANLWTSQSSFISFYSLESFLKKLSSVRILSSRTWPYSLPLPQVLPDPSLLSSQANSVSSEKKSKTSSLIPGCVCMAISWGRSYPSVATLLKNTEPCSLSSCIQPIAP